MIMVLLRTPHGKAFKERMSERLSGVVGRQNEKRQPLLGKGNALSPLDELKRMGIDPAKKSGPIPSTAVGA